MRRPSLCRNDRVILGPGVGEDDRCSGPTYGDDKAEQNGPDPVTWIPAEPPLPCRRQPPESPRRRLQAVAAFEAVLLIGAVGRTTAGTERRLLRGAHCSQGSCADAPAATAFWSGVTA